MSLPYSKLVAQEDTEETASCVLEVSDASEEEGGCPPFCLHEDEPSPFAEWRIRVGVVDFDVANQQTPGSCFRDPHTGESVIAADAYLKLVEGVSKHRSTADRTVAIVLFILFFAFLKALAIVLGLLKVDEDTFNLFMIMGIFLMWIPSWAVCLVTVIPSLEKSRNSEIQKLVEERRNEFLKSYGIELGYHLVSAKKTFPRLYNDSHVWLRQPRQHPPATPDDDEKLLSTVNLPQEFPPVYLHHLVPGDISISDEIYHPSVQMDKDTWTLIQNTHRAMAKVPSMKVFFGICFLSYVLAHHSYEIMTHFGFWILLCVWIVLGCVWYLFLTWSENQSMRSYQSVADTVSRILQAREEADTNAMDHVQVVDNPYGYTYNECMASYTLQLKTSPLPGRPGALSRRYQLVHNSYDTAATSSSTTY